jgi:predicted amidohydrolase YtcJ
MPKRTCRIGFSHSATLGKRPKLAPEDQVNSTRVFMREMNGFGSTSCIDAGGGYQNYPDDYKIISDLAIAGQLTVRIAQPVHLAAQASERGIREVGQDGKAQRGDAVYRMNGAGEMLVYSAAEPRPDVPKTMEAELTEVVTLLAKTCWPFRLHATDDETIRTPSPSSRFVTRRVNEVTNLRFAISPKSRNDSRITFVSRRS